MLDFTVVALEQPFGNGCQVELGVNISAIATSPSFLFFLLHLEPCDILNMVYVLTWVCVLTCEYAFILVYEPDLGI